jgi:hypothetical protein
LATSPNRDANSLRWENRQSPEISQWDVSSSCGSCSEIWGMIISSTVSDDIYPARFGLAASRAQPWAPVGQFCLMLILRQDDLSEDHPRRGIIPGKSDDREA